MKAAQEKQEHMPLFGKHSQRFHFTVICRSYSRFRLHHSLRFLINGPSNKACGFSLCSVSYCLIFIWSRYFPLGWGKEGREVPGKGMAAEACGCSWIILQDSSVWNANPFRKPAGSAGLIQRLSFYQI